MGDDVRWLDYTWAIEYERPIVRRGLNVPRKRRYPVVPIAPAWRDVSSVPESEASTERITVSGLRFKPYAWITPRAGSRLSGDPSD